MVKLEIVKLLLDAGGLMLISQDNDGNTPLYWAAYNGHLEIVKLLLDNHADANLQNNDGKAPLDAAKEKGQSAIIELLRQQLAQTIELKD